MLWIKATISANDQLSSCINDRQGSMRIDNGYCNKDYGLLDKYYHYSTSYDLPITLGWFSMKTESNRRVNSRRQKVWHGMIFNC